LVNEKLEQIDVTPKYLEAALDFYIQRILSITDKETLKQYQSMEKEILRARKFKLFDSVKLRALLVENLLEKTLEDKEFLKEKTDLRETFLRWQRKTAALRLQIPAAFELDKLTGKELDISINQISSEVQDLLKKYIEKYNYKLIGQLLVGQYVIWDFNWLFPTETAYVGDCRDAGVPIPPDWGDRKWEEIGTLENEFIDTDSTAVAFIYESDNPLGTCVALPRINSEGTSVDVFGIICLGIETEKACFWDKHDTPIAEYEDDIKIEEFMSGVDFTGSGGNCASCHAGENPFVIHPDANIAGNADISVDWHEPLFPPSWPSNPGPVALASDTSFSNADWYNPFSWFSGSSDGQSCAQCHKLPNVAHDALRLEGYCDLVLGKAANITMPPGGGDVAGWGSSNSSDFQIHIEQLYDWCN